MFVFMSFIKFGKIPAIIQIISLPVPVSLFFWDPHSVHALISGSQMSITPSSQGHCEQVVLPCQTRGRGGVPEVPQAPVSLP